MLFGYCPFESASIAKLIMTIENDELSFPEEPVVSNSIHTLLKRMLVKDPTKRADWNEVFSFEIIDNKMSKNLRDEPTLLKNNSLVMQTSTTITDNSGNFDLMDSLQRCNTDNLADQINIINSTYEISPTKNQQPKIRLKTKASLKEDSKEFFQSFKSSGISNTLNPKNIMK
jgi:serine/threonine protein kinase